MEEMVSGPEEEWFKGCVSCDPLQIFEQQNLIKRQGFVIFLEKSDVWCLKSIV
jgi:hypothetical protein